MLTRVELGSVVDKLKKEGINFFDFNDYVYNNYNKSNIDQIMKKRIDNYWDHYTEEGYRVLAEQISIEITKHSKQIVVE